MAKRTQNCIVFSNCANIPVFFCQTRCDLSVSILCVNYNNISAKQGDTFIIAISAEDTFLFSI